MLQHHFLIKPSLTLQLRLNFLQPDIKGDLVQMASLQGDLNMHKRWNQESVREMGMLTGCVTELVIPVGNCSILLGTSGHHVGHASALSHQGRGSGSIYPLALALLAWGLTMASASELKVVLRHVGGDHNVRYTILSSAPPPRHPSLFSSYLSLSEIFLFTYSATHRQLSILYTPK